MNDIKKTEEFMTQFSRKPPPSGLRAIVLDAAAKKKEQTRLLSPALIKIALIAGVTAIAFMIIDAGLEGSQKKRFASFTGHQQNIPQERIDLDFILEDFVAGDSNAPWAILRLKIGNRAKEKEARVVRKQMLRREIDEY
jgi:ABC-type lipoprotein release transport system permease subunit